VYFPGTPVSSTNKTDHLDITEILLKVVLSTLNQTNKQNQPYDVYFRTKTDKQ
jgi:membrane-anchored protein YejM (alkaline phosphatase superfamily)